MQWHESPMKFVASVGGEGMPLACDIELADSTQESRIDDQFRHSGRGSHVVGPTAIAFQSCITKMLGRSARAIVMFITCWLMISPTTAADAISNRSDKTSRYTMVEGRGWSACETYLKSLNDTEIGEPPLCDLRLGRASGWSEPKWEQLDIRRHLTLVHQIELLLGRSHIEPEPEQDFERWKLQFEERTRRLNQQPRLRLTRMALAAGGDIETLLTYDQDAEMCRRESDKARQGKLFRANLGEPNFFVLDEATQKVKGSSYWVTTMQGALLLHRQRPYYLDLYLEAFADAAQVRSLGHFRGQIFVRRLEKVPPSPSRELNLPDDPLYREHQLCQIRFEFPLRSIVNR